MKSDLVAMGSRPSRADQTLAKKRRLLDVAREQFVQQGFRSVTMEVIAMEAGVSKRTLYLWHEDKAALFTACVVDGTRRLPTLRCDPGVPVRRGLLDFGVALLREFSDPSTVGMGKLVVREAHDFIELAGMVQRSYDQHLVCPLANYLRRMAVADDSAHDAASLLIAMILAPVHNQLLMGSALPGNEAMERSVTMAVDTFLLGLGLVDQREEKTGAATGMADRKTVGPLL